MGSEGEPWCPEGQGEAAMDELRVAKNSARAQGEGVHHPFHQQQQSLLLFRILTETENPMKIVQKSILLIPIQKNI